MNYLQRVRQLIFVSTAISTSLAQAENTTCPGTPITNNAVITVSSAIYSVKPDVCIDGHFVSASIPSDKLYKVKITTDGYSENQVFLNFKRMMEHPEPATMVIHTRKNGKDTSHIFYLEGDDDGTDADLNDDIADN